MMLPSRNNVGQQTFDQSETGLHQGLGSNSKEVILNQGLRYGGRIRNNN